MLFVTYIFRQITRRGEKNLIIGFLLAVLTAILASLFIFSKAFENEVVALSEFFPHMSIQRVAGGRLVLSDTVFADSLRKMTGVKKVVPRTFGYIADDATGAVLTVWSAEGEFYGLNSSENRFPDTSEVFIGRGFSEAKALFEGDFVVLRNSENEAFSFKIAKVFDAETDLLTRDLLILHPKTARKVLDTEAHHCTDFAVWLGNEEETDNLARKIKEKYTGLRINTKSQLKATYLNVFSFRSGLFLYMLIFVLAALSLLIWERLSSFSRAEREEISLLKALGWSVPLIVRLRLFESLSVAFAGFLLGFFLAVIHAEWGDSFWLKNFLSGDGVIKPAFHLSFDYSFETVLLTAAVVILPFTAASVVPAWRLSVSEPDDLG